MHFNLVARGYLLPFAVIMVMAVINCDASAALFLNADDLAASEAFATDPRFDAVGAVGFMQEGSGYLGGSGVLIAPNWILTAGHVVDGIENFPLFFAYGTGSGIPDVFVDAIGYRMHPQYSDIWGNDLALIELATPILDITPAIRYRDTDPNFSVAPQQYFMAGFGRNGIVNTPLEPHDIIMRAGSNIARRRSSLLGNTIAVDFGLINDAVDLEWKGTPGDSGGGWFMNVDGSWQA